VTHLKKMMLEDLQRRNYSQDTIRSYVHTVEDFARYFNCRPDRLGPRHIREYQAALFQKRELSSGSVAVRLAALRFFYCKTLKRAWSTAETPMASLRVQNSPAPGAPKRASPDSLAGLVRLLVSRILEGRPASACQSAGAGEEILYETEFDGARYLLVRVTALNLAKVSLSPREQEIVRMVAEGHPNKIIADVLNISAWTVCTHLRRIFAKLGVGSRAAMVARLLEPIHDLSPVNTRDSHFLYQRFSSLVRDEACQFRNQQTRTAVKWRP
jgi:DNA-binding CsgD family transcriptional regulator